MRALLPLILSASVAGCATVGAEKIDQMKPGTTIAPVSVMGDSLSVRSVGTTVFQNERRDADVSAWQVDRHTEAAAGRVLGDARKFTVVQADTAGARKDIKLKDDFWSGGAKLEGGAAPITGVASQAKADYVLLIGPAPYGDPFFGTNQSLSGYGIYQRSFLGMKRAVNFLTMRAILLDGKSGQEVARTACFHSSPRPESEWMEGEALARATEAENRGNIEKLLEDGLRKCLSGLKLAS